MDPRAYFDSTEVDPRPIASLAEAFERLEAAGAPFASTGERALAAGFAADRLGYAFLGGYEAALTCLVGTGARAALCATEEGGAHPRAIRTRLEPSGDSYRVTGSKSFATLATAAQVLYVIASEGERDGKNVLRLVRVASDAAGVSITPRPPIAFAPEIPHATIRFDRVRVGETDLLPGDGYTQYLKPFRTIEDVHVFLATLGFLARVAREQGWRDQLAIAGHAQTLLALAAADPSAPATHLSLAAAIDSARTHIAQLPWGEADETTRSRWERDQPLLWVAEQARMKRTEAARSRSG